MTYVITIFINSDSDEDGITDLHEIYGEEFYHGYATDPNDADSDDDGLSDWDEIATHTDPNDPDSDDDGLMDGDEVSTAQILP